MKKTILTAVSVILTLALLFGLAVNAFAQSDFADNAYATVITASDFQDKNSAAFDRFEGILSNMKDDGMPTPHSMISGGDYSKMWPDYATPGVMQVRDAYANVFPDADTDSVVCIQGNHDFLSAGFTQTGYYDMGAYNLYVINENDFNWNQFLRVPTHIKNTAEKLESTLSDLAAKQDFRPVIIVTHVPLHHTDRTLCGDNKYSSYLFNVINEAAKKLDIIFIFGHNHSGDYDDYIGGAVNFLAPGDEIRIPLTDKIGEDCYTVETLNFTYTNCGYVGYSGNGTENGSTDKLTVSAIQFTEDSFHFVKYSEEGLFGTYDVDRINQNTTVSDSEPTTTLVNEALYNLMIKIIEFFKSLFAGNAPAFA